MTAHSAGFNNVATRPLSTRESLRLPLGQLAEALLGGDSLRREMDSQSAEERAQQAAGATAVKIGALSPETRDALLIAQAAERAALLADKAADYAKNATSLTSYYNRSGAQFDAQAAGAVPYNDPVFKYVGSAKDSPRVAAAQATWQMAQMYLNNEIGAIDFKLNTSPGLLSPMGPLSKGAVYADGFAKAAVSFYREAADMLTAQGHANAAKKLTLAAGQIERHNPRYAHGHDESAVSPAHLAGRLAQDDAIAAHFTNGAILRDEDGPSSYARTLERLGGLIEKTGPATALARTAAPKHA